MKKLATLLILIYITACTNVNNTIPPPENIDPKYAVQENDIVSRYYEIIKIENGLVYLAPDIVTACVTMFYVIKYDSSLRAFIPYNVIPYFISCYNREQNKPETFDDFKAFIIENSSLEFTKNNYALILNDTINERKENWNAHMQIVLNIDLVTKILMQELK